MDIVHELMKVNEAPSSEEQFQAFYRQELESVNLGAETFTHSVTAYQELARQSNVEAEKTLNLIHTTEAMLRGKEAMNRLPALPEDTFVHPDDKSNEDAEFDDDANIFDSDNDDGADAGPSNSGSLPAWVTTKEIIDLKPEMVIGQAYLDATAEYETANDGRRKEIQRFITSLKLHKSHLLKSVQGFDAVRLSVDKLREDTTSRIDKLLPKDLLFSIQRRLVKESMVESSFQKLDKRVGKVEAQLDKLLEVNQTNQDLLRLLLDSPILNPDDNKKGEKEGVSEQANSSRQIPITTDAQIPITTDADIPVTTDAPTCSTTDNIIPSTTDVPMSITTDDVIPATINEDTISRRISQLSPEKHWSPPRTDTIIRRIEVSATNVPTSMVHGLGGSKRGYKVGQVDDLVIQHESELEKEIQLKADAEAALALRKEIEKELRAEEKAQIESDDIAARELHNQLNEEDGIPIPPRKLSREPKSRQQRRIKVMKKGKVKATAQRPNYEEIGIKEELMEAADLNVAESSKEPAAGSSKGKEKVQDAEVPGIRIIDPFHNIHDEPIVQIPKDEPIEFDSIPVPEFLKQVKPKSRKGRGGAHVSKSSTVTRELQPVTTRENRDDYMYLMKIEEPSPLDLHPEDFESVKAFKTTSRLPERMSFWYTHSSGRPSVTHPVNLVLNESFRVLVGTFSKMKSRGFTEVIKTRVMNKINELRNRWNELPRSLKIPYTGKTVHKEPHLLMEFKDKHGVRNFFRIKDQLKIAKNVELRFLQTKLNPQVGEEADFYRLLQDQIERNLAREQGRIR